MALLDLGKYQNEQSHEVSWVWLQNCGHGAQILGNMGHNGPCPCGIGLNIIQHNKIIQNMKWQLDKTIEVEEIILLIFKFYT